MGPTTRQGWLYVRAGLAGSVTVWSIMGDQPHCLKDQHARWIAIHQWQCSSRSLVVGSKFTFTAQRYCRTKSFLDSWYDVQIAIINFMSIQGVL